MSGGVAACLVVNGIAENHVSAVALHDEQKCLFSTSFKSKPHGRIVGALRLSSNAVLSTRRIIYAIRRPITIVTSWRDFEVAMLQDTYKFLQSIYNNARMEGR